MAGPNNTASQIMGLVTVGVCVLALFDKRFRDVCWSFICKL